MTRYLNSPCSIRRSLGGALGSAQIGVQHQKSFVGANNVIRIKERNNVSVAAKERRRKKNRYNTKKERGKDSEYTHRCKVLNGDRPLASRYTTISDTG